MNESIKAVHLAHTDGELSDVSAFGSGATARAATFHRSLPTYEPTPLADLRRLSAVLGLSRLAVKDESGRFGLNAFKGLGTSYAVARYLAQYLGLAESEMTYENLTKSEYRDRLRKVTLVTATDGNHGRGIAWAAKLFGLFAHVFMPKGSSTERLANIRGLGAEASFTTYNYDDTVRHAANLAKEKGWVLVQDTAFEGYTERPLWIMQGYTTLAHEAVEQYDEVPTHIFLQAGVGSLPGAIAGYFAAHYGAKRPVITIVEPNRADCIYRTAAANDGKPHIVTGEISSIMAGLSCGEPNPIAWEILRDHADHFVSVPEWVAAKGMRILGNPLDDDPRVVSGESGAVTTGLVAELMQNRSLDYLRDAIGLGKDSRILCISTEGDTDRANYRRVVWDGLYPSY
ncbi:diaminopropionate ammonia-lyase [Selenomonas sp. oral taxon 920]|uniref:diaminopropionate ammonia-lyase n=1 Tax=Selenomonas sp. oral taxon 920 TaxID=1884263 RepID=UPI000840F579|nr:diaminopropionate ammonia-lyase [Selenomonas sp. oral taxon 920]AOH47042.1 diaminopropionate ammonia-lyase [Selenomonas sp. oral taxon 920]